MPKEVDYSKYAHVDESKDIHIVPEPVDNSFILKQLPESSQLLRIDTACSCGSILGDEEDWISEDIDSAIAKVKKKWWWSEKKFVAYKQKIKQEAIKKQEEGLLWINLIRRIIEKDKCAFLGILKIWGDPSREKVKIKETVKVRLAEVNEKFLHLIAEDKLYLITL
jgi:hypothetical protein